MDWFTWLSKTGLEATLVYEYGLAFAHNELEEEDMSYFNHEFLQSMGISIAKHRLEILKLARKEKRGRHPMSRVLVAIRRTKRSVTRYLRTWIRRYEEEEEEPSSSALVVVPWPAGCSSRWRGARLKRNKNKMIMGHQSSSRLLLTDGRSPAPMWVSGPRLDSFSSPLSMIYDVYKEEKVVDSHHDGGHWTSAVEEIRWDTMFQNLKPT